MAVFNYLRTVNAMVTIHEPVRVAAIHGPGASLRPVWFDWNSRRHDVREVAYHWKESLGCEVIHHYAVSDGCGLYDLSYNATRQVWMLESVEEQDGAPRMKTRRAGTRV